MQLQFNFVGQSQKWFCNICNLLKLFIEFWELICLLFNLVKGKFTQK